MSEVSNERSIEKQSSQDERDKSDPNYLSFANDGRLKGGGEGVSRCSTLGADYFLDAKLNMALDHLEKATNEIQEIRRKRSKPLSQGDLSTTNEGQELNESLKESIERSNRLETELQKLRLQVEPYEKKHPIRSSEMEEDDKVSKEELRQQSSKSTELDKQNEQIKSELQIQKEENMKLHQDIDYFREKLQNSESRALAWINSAREAEDRTKSLKQENQKLKLKVEKFKLLLIDFAPDLVDDSSNNPKKRKRVAKEIIHNGLERIGENESDEKEGRHSSGNCSESEDSASDNCHALKALINTKLQQKKRKDKLTHLQHGQGTAHLNRKVRNDSADSSESEYSVSDNFHAVKDHSKKSILQKKMKAKLSRLLDDQVMANHEQGARNDFADSSESEDLVNDNSNAGNALQTKMKAKPSRPQDEQKRAYSQNTHIPVNVGSTGPQGIQRLPADWRFPRCAVPELWGQWWLGEPERNIPPLWTLTHRDVKFLDGLPLSEEELKGRTGRYPMRRQPAQKILWEMTSLMRFLTHMVEEADAFEDEINAASVYKMFNSILPQLCEWVDFRQLHRNKWNTFRRSLAPWMKESKPADNSGNTVSL